MKVVILYILFSCSTGCWCEGFIIFFSFLKQEGLSLSPSPLRVRLEPATFPIRIDAFTTRLTQVRCCLGSVRKRISIYLSLVLAHILEVILVPSVDSFSTYLSYIIKNGMCLYLLILYILEISSCLTYSFLHYLGNQRLALHILARRVGNRQYLVGPRETVQGDSFVDCKHGLLL